MHILVVEDESITRNRLQRYLEKWGHQVETADDGLVALELFISGNFDIVLTDWMMPEMDGVQLIHHIRRQIPDGRFVYIILLTAKNTTDDVVRGLSEVGADDYITKPFETEELRARINVGERTVRLERELAEYNRDLEKIIQRQTSTIRRTHEEAIMRLLNALESRDHDTGGHVQRIATLSHALARAAGWSERRADDIRLAAPMHDIGKIGIPDAILRKPGALTKDEFAIVKTHTVIAGQILTNSGYPMLQMAYDIAMYHHEWWDGSGYPEGRQGESIPEAARIVAIVDVYDALTHDRVYSRAQSHEEAMGILKASAGSQFDPYLLDLFVDVAETQHDLPAEPASA